MSPRSGSAGSPPAVEVDEIVDCLFGDFVDVDVAERVDGDAQLGEVLRAVRAVSDRPLVTHLRISQSESSHQPGE